MARCSLPVRPFVLFAVFVVFNTAAGLARADDPCAAFTWDIRQERSLFSQQPQSLAVGQTLNTHDNVVTLDERVRALTHFGC